MADINGSFSGWGSDKGYPIIRYSYSQDIVNNFTDITATLIFKRTGSYYAYNLSTHSNTSNIDSETNYSGDTDFDLRPGTGEYSLRTVTKRVYHNADGTRQVWIGWSGDTKVSPGTYNFGATITLPTIPREAYITNAVSFQVGNNIPLTIYNAGSMYLKVKLYVNGSLIKTVNAGQVSSYTITPTSGENDSMYAQIPSATSCAMFVRIETYSDAGYSVRIGGDRDQAGTMTIDQTANKPTFTDYAIANVDKSIVVQDKYSNTLITSSTDNLVGSNNQRIIKGISKIRATISSANKMVAKNSATAVKYRLVNDTQQAEVNYSASDVTVDIDNATSLSTSVTAFDSRSLSTAVAKALATMVEWSAVSIGGMSLTRQNGVDAITTLAFSGTFWKNYFGGGSNGVLNTITCAYRYKETTQAWGAQSWTTITPSSDGSGNITFSSAINGDLGANGFTTSKAFNIEVRIFDKLSQMIIEGTLSTGIPLIDYTKNGIAIKSKYDTTEGGSAQVDGKSIGAFMCQTGMYMPYAPPIAGLNIAGVPAGWLLCNGQAVSRTTYARLFAALNPSQGTCIISNANPCVVTQNGHGLVWGSAVYFTTTGALPTGLSPNVVYYVGYVDANTFKLCTTIANAMAGTYIATSSAGSGTHTLWQSPYGVGNGSTTFNVPNMVTRTPVGQQPNNNWNFTSLGLAVGSDTQTLSIANLPSHDHGNTGTVSSDHQHNAERKEMDAPDGGSYLTGLRPWGYSSDGLLLATSGITANHVHWVYAVGSGTAHNNMQPSMTTNFIIKT